MNPELEKATLNCSILFLSLYTIFAVIKPMLIATADKKINPMNRNNA